LIFTGNPFYYREEIEIITDRNEGCQKWLRRIGFIFCLSFEIEINDPLAYFRIFRNSAKEDVSPRKKMSKQARVFAMVINMVPE
jgi:hypothetical protein